MNFRRLIKQKTGLTIFLPIAWVRQNNLKKGDHVKVEEQTDGSLKVSVPL
jgi:antitoxin component of MazEF toxin-antitoxin module